MSTSYVRIKNLSSMQHEPKEGDLFRHRETGYVYLLVSTSAPDGSYTEATCRYGLNSLATGGLWTSTDEAVVPKQAFGESFSEFEWIVPGTEIEIFIEE